MKLLTILRPIWAIIILHCALAYATPVNITERAVSGYQNVVYYVNWAIYGRNYQPQDLPASQISHVLYSFLNVRPSGEVYASDVWSDIQKHYPTDSWNDIGNNVYGCVKQLYLLKKANRRMKTLLSIGGWTYSSNFASAASTPETRALFAQSAVNIMKDWGFDGIDIDWEYPSDTTQSRNFVLLLQAVRQEMDTYAAHHAPGYHLLLTVASPAGPSHYNVLDLKGISDVIDSFNLMAYDFAGSWDSRSGHLANLYPSTLNPSATPFSADKAIRDYMAAGVPARKIVMGMPIYGRAFLNTDSIGQPYQGVGSGSWENGVWDYKDLPKSGAAVLYDGEAHAAYSFDGAKRELISYDTPSVIREKVSYLKGLGMGGSMFWEASGDRSGGDSLIWNSFDGLGGAGAQDSAENLLSYPDSVYDNLRAGMPS